MKKLLTTTAAVIMTLTVAAQQNELNVDAQLRTRAEYNNGAQNPRAEGEKPATFINERARLGVGWERNNLKLKVAVQHVGVWGQDDIKDRNGRVAMNEAWGKISFGKNNSHFVQVGRQQLSYDDERILGGLDWNVAGNWHDAIRYGWEADQNGLSDKLHVAFAYNQNSENVRGTLYNPNKMLYKTMLMVWYHAELKTAPLSFSVMAMNLGRESTELEGKTKYMQLLGTDINYKPGSFKLHGAFYYEFGKSAANRKISAWMASAGVNYKISDGWNLGVGYDYLSGQGDSDKDQAFDPLFGTHHKFGGFMDYFTGKQKTGLQDIQVNLAANVSQKFTAQANYHYFLTAQKVADYKKSLGHEIDLQLTWKVMKDVTLQGGYSFMLGTDTFDAIKTTSDHVPNHKSWQDWAWVSLNINPRIFSTKW